MSSRIDGGFSTANRASGSPTHHRDCTRPRDLGSTRSAQRNLRRGRNDRLAIDTSAQRRCFFATIVVGFRRQPNETPPQVATSEVNTMVISSKTPEGLPASCPVCGSHLKIQPSDPAGVAPCHRWASTLVHLGRPRRCRDHSSHRTRSATGTLDGFLDSVAIRPGVQLVLDLERTVFFQFGDVSINQSQAKGQIRGRPSRDSECPFRHPRGISDYSYGASFSN